MPSLGLTSAVARNPQASRIDRCWCAFAFADDARLSQSSLDAIRAALVVERRGRYSRSTISEGPSMSVAVQVSRTPR